jgi:CheY-like chemotaxis protein
MNPTATDEQLERSARILVVDDEEVVRTVMRDVLDRPGWYLVEAADGEKAIELLLSEPFDLLIADKNLPGITGLDVIRQAKAANQRIATLLVTAYASRESAEEALVLGVDDYLTKPFDMDDLSAKVEDALARRRHRMELEQETMRPKAKSRLRRRVMVCDPGQSSRRLLVAGLEVLGHRVQTEEVLGKVLESLRRGGFDALVCDLDLLNRDNASACFLRSALIMSSGVRFVVVAAERGLEGAISAIHRGANKVLYRPLVSAQVVADELREFLDESG